MGSPRPKTVSRRSRKRPFHGEYQVYVDGVYMGTTYAGHGARALHDEPAGAERPLPERGSGRHGLRRGAVNEEIRDLFAAGADIVQVDEPYMQPEKARQYGLKALNRALEGIAGQTAVHICFGYAAIIHRRPSGYSFLPELAGCSCRQVSVETAQSNLDCSVLAKLEGKQIMVGCLDLNDMRVETPEVVVARIRGALPYVQAENVILAPDCGMKYLPRDVAFGKLQAMVKAARMLRAEFGGG